MSQYYDDLETRTPTQREADLFTKLAEQIEHAKKNAPALAEQLAGTAPGPIDSRETLAGLPLLRKSELSERQRRTPPFGNLVTVKPPELGNIFASPGPIYEPGGKRGDYWRFARALYAAGFRSGELLHNCFSYHFTPAGAMVESAAQGLGCAVIPAGVGNTELQVQTMADLRPAGYVGTPSFLKIILEKGEELGADLSSLSKALVSGEYLSPSLRAWFAERGIVVLQCYATADLGMIAYESPAQEGMIVDEGIILEIVRPGTGDPVADGEVGEVVVTSLNPDYPLLRFATGDLSAVLAGTSPCGRTNLRIKGWMGRADQTTKVRGMFVHPSQVAQVLKQHPQVSKGRLVVERHNDQDCMQLHCELPAGAATETLATELVATLRDICKLRGEVRFVEANSLPNDGKVIDDLREIE